jgi:asparagine synthase (glutamine-hydrolysing)
MCGIAGIYRFGERAQAARADARAADSRVLAAMLAAIAHRGPDDSSAFEHDRVALGVRRLAILDLVGGRQPLSDETGALWAGNNGELYNYREVRAELTARGHSFRTQADTEILPHLYAEHGADFARRIEGMFAAFVHDTRDGRLVVARDRCGIKPLYYAATSERLVFASEIRALLADPALPTRVAPARFSDYLALGWVPGEETVLEGIRRVPPGHRLVADPSGFRVEPYEDPVLRRAPIPADPAGRLDELERRIAFAVERQLVSDVPLGVLLSGGIDSSLVTALLPRELRAETRTFCVGFAGGGHHDETQYARRVAAHLGTRHTERVLHLDAEALTRRAAAHFDEPLADPAAVPALAVAEVAAREVKVLLSGTGGDELFGGYRRYRLGRMLARLSALPRPLAGALAGALEVRVGSRRSRAAELSVHAGKMLNARSAPDFLTAYLGTQSPASDRIWRALCPELPAGPMAALAARFAPFDDPARPPEARAFAWDRRYYLPDDLLLKEDRMTMAVSVEGRVPLLDERVAEFADALPAGDKIRGATGKWILRELARRHVPPDLVDRPKHGFSVPVTEWLRGPLAALARDALASGGASGAWDPAGMRRALDDHASGRRDRGGALWTALAWELWWASPSGPGGRPRTAA